MQDYDFLFFDEAQQIHDIGWGLKILVDNLPQTTIIASGSSSFQLSSEVGAPLTGRSCTPLLYPISLMEIRAQFGGMSIFQNLENYMVFGMYPDVLTTPNKTYKKAYNIELRKA